MNKEIVIFLHGYATRGGLRAEKARFLHGKFSTYSHIDFHAIDFNPTHKDFQYHTITGMIDRLRQYIIERNFAEVSLIGISQGANVALNYAHRYGDVKRLLLLAPELFYDSYSTEEALQEWVERVNAQVFHYGFKESTLLNYGHHQDGLRYVNPPAPPAPMTLIHGVDDPAIPIERSRNYAVQYPDNVDLIEVESDHFLNDQMTLYGKRQEKYLVYNVKIIGL
ncbi:MAG: alpha/beta hydrolase [Caldilineaceae bacterium]